MSESVKLKVALVTWPTLVYPLPLVVLRPMSYPPVGTGLEAVHTILTCVLVVTVAVTPPGAPCEQAGTGVAGTSVL